MLPQPDRMVVECGALIEQVVGADDGGVAAGVAAADPALFEHCDVGEAMLAREVVGCSQSVTAAADDEGVIGGLGLGTAPLRRPAALAGQAPYQQRQAGEGLHRRVLLGCDASARASCAPRLAATSTRAPTGLNGRDMVATHASAARSCWCTAAGRITIVVAR